MRTLAIDSLGIPFVAVCLVVWMGVVLAVARLCGTNERRAERETHNREVLGELAADRAAREARLRRAQFRQAERWGRRAS